ncbi:DC-STAMP-like protein [Oesophagostomum dentatum]|uniref:DC-STAMP-like protein n=1 Tax=Oesophagostomum dentatum TaxID=61180 RepID=A0A0B1SW25_OESDE|nr:DC-STAMP-like protein [Oesophagostomum dentatum]
MNAVTNIHRVAEGIACVQADVTSSLDDVKSRAGDVKTMIANKLKSLIVKLAVPINKLRALLRNLDSKLRRVVEAIRKQFRSYTSLTDLCVRFMKKPYAIVLLVNGYFYLMKNALAVGTKTAEKAFVFHIEAAKKVVKGAKFVKKEIADIRHMEVHYQRGGEGAGDLAVHKKLKKSLLAVIESYIRMFEMMQTVIKWMFIPLTLFWPFISTALFTFKFNYREDFENNYITEEFEKIDLDMVLKGRTKALPLNKDEKLLVLSSVFYFTNLVNVDYPSHFEVKVSGSGQAAELMRIIQNVFSPLTSGIKKREERWRNCFVEPTPPDVFTLRSIVAMFIISIFLCRFQVWMSRQTLALADHFFPDRKQLADDQMEGREAVVRRGLQSRGFIRVNCSICNEQDLRLADQANTRLCIKCGAFYCIRCFCLRRYCKDCQNDMQTIDRVELYYEDASDDEESEEEEEQ